MWQVTLILLDTLYFFGLTLLLKNNTFCNLRTTRVQYMYLMALTDYIPNSVYFLSLDTLYLSAKKITFKCEYELFFTQFLEVKTKNTHQENIYILYTIYRVF